ncbi:protoporphyrinogen oxidase [Kaarinaea lacus]
MTKKVVIVGAGISGLSLAYLLRNSSALQEVTVLESQSRAGGKIGSERIDGFLCEKGPSGFLDNKPKTLELCAALGIDPLRSNDNAKIRYLFTHDKLTPLPESPPAFIKSDILSWRGKLRLLLEPLISKGPEDESVATFVTRRLGAEALQQMIDPMVSGVYAGDPANMSIKSAFPRIKELEQQYGSLIKALIKIQKQRKRAATNPSQSKVSVSPGGTLSSFADGVQTLTDTLAESLGDDLVVDTPVRTIEYQNKSYQVHTESRTYNADIVVLATPAYAAAQMLASANINLSTLLENISYPHVSVVCLGYRKDKIEHALNGFGFLIPHNERRQILGTLWDSSIFPHRAPEGKALLRTMIGGAQFPQLAEWSEQQLLDTVRQELKLIMGIDVDPDMAQVYKWGKAIPQYQLQHQKLLADIDTCLLSQPGLYLSGNAYRGIGMNDCITNAYALSDAITAAIA